MAVLRHILSCLLSVAVLDSLGQAQGAVYVPQTPANQAAVVDLLNGARSNVDPLATNMEQLVWSDAIATELETYAMMCLSIENPNPSAYGGEIVMLLVPNMVNQMELELQVTSWVISGSSYPYPDFTVADEYRQIVTATATEVACVVVDCNGGFDGAPVNLGQSRQIRCAFDIARDDNARPYLTGAADSECTACASGNTACCINNLCAEEEACNVTTTGAPDSTTPALNTTTAETTTAEDATTEEMTTVTPMATTTNPSVSIGLIVGLSVFGFLAGLLMLLLLICCLWRFCFPRGPIALGRTPVLPPQRFAPRRPFTMPYPRIFAIRPYRGNNFYPR